MRPAVQEYRKGAWTRPNSYEVWLQMRRRCRVPNRFYSDRGITVCERWQTFANFYADMGDRPAGKSLDRIDGDGNYEPANCRWADDETQHNNTRTNVFLTIDGRTQTVAQWCREKGCRPSTVSTRRARGWPTERLFEPAGLAPAPSGSDTPSGLA